MPALPCVTYHVTLTLPCDEILIGRVLPTGITDGTDMDAIGGFTVTL